MSNTIENIIPNKEKALFLAKKQLPELVTDAINLEGINFTLPEVQTLLDGVTVGGHKLTDQTITMNQANAWAFIFNACENDTFELSKQFVCDCHDIAAKNEALSWGAFRTGQVTIAGTDHQPPPASQLDTLWEDTIAQLENIPVIYDAAISLFLQMARNQFFYDVNKRMGRFMMNGLLLSRGYPVINLPAARQLEFNTLMLAFYSSNDMTAMIAFMKSCLTQRVIEIMSEG